MEILINSFVVLFVVIDPIGVALVFNTLTRNTEVEHQRRTALRGVALATGILLVFFLIGDALLQRLGISIPAMRIAGGTLLFLLAIDMIFARQSGLRSTTRREQHEAEHKEDVSVFPLAFPLIAGPGGADDGLADGVVVHRSVGVCRDDSGESCRAELRARVIALRAQHYAHPW